MYFTRSKGQVAFEFIVVLAAILFLSTSVMLDFFNESNLTLMAGQTKNLLENQIGAMTIADPACLGTFLKSFNITKNTDLNRYEFLANVRGPCRVDDGKVAKEVESSLCNFAGNENNVIECGIYKYNLMVTWKPEDEKE